MSIIKTISTFFLMTIFLSNVSLAEGEKLADKLSRGTLTITAEIKGCHSDARQFCPGLPVGSQKSFMCLMAYEDKLSNPCKLGISEAAMALKMGVAAIDYSVSACEADADKYCLDVKPGEGRLVSCLKKHESKVDKACITALKETGFWEMGTK